MPHPANLPDFRGLVVNVYSELDAPTHDVLSAISNQQVDSASLNSIARDLNESQKAEVLRFCKGDYDVVLGMLERRLDGSSNSESKVRNAVRKVLREGDHKPAQIHRALMRLAESGNSTAIITTNFDLLLEEAARSIKSPIQTYSLGGIPRPTRTNEFSGVMHIHGALDRDPKRTADLVLTDRDLGEFYLRRRIVPDLIYDAARLFNLVLVGYSANDPPMRYLLNAVAADRERFSDLKERFVFVGCENYDPVELEDWRSRGLTPIPYTIQNGAHDELSNTLNRWAELSTSKSKRRVHSLIKKLTSTSRRTTSQNDRDLFDYIIRRSHSAERNQICLLLSSQKAETEWLDAITEVTLENEFEPATGLTNGDWEARNNKAVNLVIAYVRGRLEERKVLKWAIESKLHVSIIRSAIKLLLQIDGASQREPWRTAWRMVEESWTNPPVDPTDLYYVRDRLEAGERTGSLILAITELVKPGIVIKPSHRFYSIQTKRKYHTLHDLVEVSLTSGDLVNPVELGLNYLTSNDIGFMVALANAIDAEVTHGIEIGRSIGWRGDDSLWVLGGLSRVDYDKSVQNFDIDEPDATNNGIAPAVKLLHEVVSMLAGVDTKEATRFVQRWKTQENSVHLRLWAALSKYPKVTPAKEVGEILLGLDQSEFWLNESYPEIAELRASRFCEFDSAMTNAITARIRKGPPLELWPTGIRSNIERQDRVASAIQELKRIQSKGGGLPQNTISWMDTVFVEFPELRNIEPAEFKKQRTSLITSDLPRSDGRLAGLMGVDRLRALEDVLTPFGGGRGNGAATWLKTPRNTLLLIHDLESLEQEEVEYPRVWEHFGWSHTPMTVEEDPDTTRDLRLESKRVIELLNKLSKETLVSARRGIVNWLDSWRDTIVEETGWVKVWCRMWPIVQESTNSELTQNHTPVKQYSSDADWLDLDTLNKPEGRLIEVFLAACRYSCEHKKKYSDQIHLLKVRDSIVNASGVSKSIAKIRLTVHIDHFLSIDPAWTKEYLISPLREHSGEVLAQWQMIGRKFRSTDFLKIVGQEITTRTRDNRLDKHTRQNLANNVVTDSLHAYLKGRCPAITNNRVQQMLRNVDDETRAYSADTVRRFLVDWSSGNDQKHTSPDAVEVFQIAIVPFFKNVWPKERSLATPGVSKALAGIPACAQDSFSEAVDIIDHLLVPFDCRSLYFYGLRSTSDQDAYSLLKQIDDENKAKALLRLFDHTIGSTENAIYPYELGEALGQISKVAPSLSDSRAYRRLTALARR